LCDAAVATGAADMPLKLPMPEDGTDAQPGPNGAEVVVALFIFGAAAALCIGADDEPFVLELHADAASATPATMVVAMRTDLLRIVTPLWLGWWKDIGGG
jgi:hypothetical protein